MILPFLSVYLFKALNFSATGRSWASVWLVDSAIKSNVPLSDLDTLDVTDLLMVTDIGVVGSGIVVDGVVVFC